MRESSSMNIIPKKVINDLSEDSYNGKIVKFIETIFTKASKTDWESTGHWTWKKNYHKITSDKELGYSYTHQNRWNQMFHKGYINTVKEIENNILGIEDSDYAYALDYCIKNMEEKFLGEANQLAYIKCEGKKTKFRELIELMFKEGKERGKYKYNPFEDSGNSSNDEELDRKIVQNYLNDVFDFKKGYVLIQKELLEHFKDCLKEEIEKENREKAEGLIKINYELFSKLEKLKYDFVKKYSEKQFNNLINYYVDKNST